MRNTVCSKNIFVKAFDSIDPKEIDGTLDSILNWSSFLTILEYNINFWDLSIHGGGRTQNICLCMETSALYHIFFLSASLC